MNIIDNILEANKLLNELDEYYDSLPSLQSKVDSQLSDLYHYIENNKLNAIQSCKIVKEIKNKREERRKILNDYEILKTYITNSNKLNNKDNRKFLICEVNKTKNNLATNYKNRYYTEEQFKTLNFEE